MGTTSASVSGTADEIVFNDVKLAADSELEYIGLEEAMRAAVASVIKNDRAVKAAIATAVRTEIIDKFNAAQAAGKPWPFQPR